MTGSPGDGADDRSADLEPAVQADVGWLLIASLMSLAGFVVLTVAVASRIVVPFDRPSLVPERGWDGWPAVWRAIWGSANASLIVIGVGIGLALLWRNRRPEPLLVPRMPAAVTAARQTAKQLGARLGTHLRAAASGAASSGGAGVRRRRRGIAGGHRMTQAFPDLTILRSATPRTWHGPRALRPVLGVVLLVAVDVLLVVAARIALDTHYPGDIMAGILGGTAALTLVTWFTSPGANAPRPVAATRTTDESEAVEAIAADSVTTPS